MLALVILIANPLRWYGLFILLRWLFIRAPRRVLHVVVPTAYDRWKIREELRGAWREHRRACYDCSREHKAHVLAATEDALIDAGEIRRRLVRAADAVDRDGRLPGLPGR